MFLFPNNNTEGIAELLAAVRNNSFGDFDVDPDALTFVLTGKYILIDYKAILSHGAAGLLR